MNRFWKQKSELEKETPAECDWEAAMKAIMEAEESKIKSIWEPLRSWFLEKGYTLYNFPEIGHYVPSMETSSQTADFPDHPYAFCGGDSFYWDTMPLEARSSEKVCFAQDVQGRHVAIKKLSKPDEIRIYQFLLEKKEILVENSILPVIDLLEYEERYFAVMPRWGEGPFFATPASVEDVLHYIRCLLKDIKEGNTLVNHFGVHSRTRPNLQRSKLRSAGQLTYSLFDFDLALMLPSPECRLGSRESFFVMSIELPFDTSHGELDYDPYKFEMGCLGIVLCQMFQHCIPSVHFLAPFFDRLITDRLESRFTAKEALDFFDQMRAKLTPEQLSAEAPIYTLPGYPFWQPEKYNRWEGLPEDFIQEWGHFRAPKPSLSRKLLRRFCLILWGERTVIAIRRFVRFLVPYVRVVSPNHFHISPHRLKK